MAHPACPKQNSTAADLAILECSLLRTGSICSIGYGLACKLFMALARGLMLNGSSGRLTESDSPQMYTYMCRHTLRRVHRKPLLMTPPSEMLSFQKSCFPGDCAHSKAVGMPSVTEKAHLQCHLGEGRLLDLCAGLQPSRCCQNSEHSTIFLQESYSDLPATPSEMPGICELSHISLSSVMLLQFLEWTQVAHCVAECRIRTLTHLSYSGTG